MKGEVTQIEVARECVALRVKVRMGLTGCGKTMPARRKFTGPHVWDNRTRPRRMLKTFVQQGRSE